MKYRAYTQVHAATARLRANEAPEEEYKISLSSNLDVYRIIPK